MSQRGLSVLDVLIVLIVLAVLLFASSREFPGFEDRVITAPTPSPAMDAPQDAAH